MSDTAAQKKSLRTRLSAVTHAIGPRQKLQAAELITARLLSLDCLSSTHCIASYASTARELPTSALNEALLRAGHRLALPRIESLKEGRMSLYQIADLNDLMVNSLGIAEPAPCPERLIRPGDLTLILLPLRGFDRSGHRLGMGGGFYDRLLTALNPSCLKIGLAFSQQEVPSLPCEAHDQCLDAVLTPGETIIFNRTVL